MSYTLKVDTSENSYVATFPQGLPQEDVLCGDDRLEFELKKNSHKRKAETLFEAENEIMKYTGNVSSCKDVKYLIGYVNENDKTVSISESPLFSIMQNVKRLKCNDNVISDNDDSSSEEELDARGEQLKKYRKSYDLKRELIEEFGGKKKRTALAAARTNKVETSTLNSSAFGFNVALDKSLGNVDVNLLEGASNDNSSTLPPRDIKASKIENVYKLEDIISKQLFDELKHPSKTFTKSTTQDIELFKNKKIYSSFIIDQIQSLSGMDLELKNTKARIIVFLNYLIIFLQSAKDLNSITSKINKGIPESFRNYFLNTFATSTFDESTGNRVYEIGKSEKDKIHSYFIVLALIMNNYKLEYKQLIACLRINPKRFKEITKALGVRSNDKTITLSLPLALTSQNRPKRRGA